MQQALQSRDETGGSRVMRGGRDEETDGMKVKRWQGGGKVREESAEDEVTWE